MSKYNKHSNKQLSPHFNSNEFDCQGNGCCSITYIDDKLVDYLEQIRTHFNQPITITSGYRCEKHNAEVGGERGSFHKEGGRATDIQVKNTAPAEVAKFAESIGIKGIGLYSNFVHIDTRDYKYFWKNSSNNSVSTFGGVVNKNSNESTNTNSTIFDGTTINKNKAQQHQTLYFGKKNADVKVLQDKLIALGYDLGVYGADGHFGTKTQLAVRQFQQATGLKVDGIVGVKTWEKLYQT